MQGALFLAALAGLGLLAYAGRPRQRWPGAPPGPVLDRVALDDWLAAREGLFPDLRPGTEKTVHWAGETGHRTPLAVVYIHGFSASRQEISPVPERIAQALGANFHTTRLAGHGRGGAALAQAGLHDWALDLAEAIAIGRQIGEKLVLIGTSTGGSLATLAALEPAWRADIAALIVISPNYALNNPLAWMLDMPWAPVWLPRLAGAEKAWAPMSPAHERFWTLRYPTRALFSLRAAQRAAARADHAAAQVPMLAFLAERDAVVRPDATRRVAARWGARAEVQVIDDAEDPFQHVITGAIRAPGTSEAVIARSLDFLNDLPAR